MWSYADARVGMVGEPERAQSQMRVTRPAGLAGLTMLSREGRPRGVAAGAARWRGPRRQPSRMVLRPLRPSIVGRACL
ncbi:MAG: hypothetical protein AB7R89_29255 [Dehalococcoidia bacterium]